MLPSRDREEGGDSADRTAKLKAAWSCAVSP